MNDKMLALLCFTIASLTDARTTDFLISIGIAEEGNPIMLTAMQVMPGGMYLLKVFVSLILLGLLSKLSTEVLLALTAGMCAILAWNFSVLLTWCFIAGAW